MQPIITFNTIFLDIVALLLTVAAFVVITTLYAFKEKKITLCEKLLSIKSSFFLTFGLIVVNFLFIFLSKKISVDTQSILITLTTLSCILIVLQLYSFQELKGKKLKIVSTLVAIIAILAVLLIPLQTVYSLYFIWKKM